MKTPNHESRGLTGYTLIYEAKTGRVGLRGLFGKDVLMESVPQEADSRSDFLDKAFAFAQKHNCRIIEVCQGPKNPRLWCAFLSSPSGANDSRAELDEMAEASLGRQAASGVKTAGAA
jgi:hypothetical protein